MKNLFASIILILLLNNISHAQETLSLSNAIETSLKNNFFLNIVKNDDQVAKNNNTLGNAGFLPTIDIAAAGVRTNNNTQQKYSNGAEIKQNNVVTDNLSAGARLNWTLFDGMKMFATRARLGETEEASALYLKLQIENTVADVIKKYFDVIRITQQIKVLEENIKIYDDRVQIAETRFTIGSASKLDFLQAKVDRNARVSEMLSLREDYNTAMANLNRLMGRSEYSNLTLTDSITINYNPVYDELRKSAMNNNKELFLDMKNVEINSSVVKEIQSQRFPVLDLNLSYNYSKVKNEVGQSLLNENDGFTRGLTLSWNIFNGFNTGREISNAKLNKLSADLTLADTRSRIDHELYVSFKKFESDKEILALEESNLEFAKENVTVALEAYRLGSISGLQLKEAQNSFETAFSRLVEARYQAKLSETELMRLNGELVK